MNEIMLETSQMLKEHPLLSEKENYKIKYLNVLEYFSQKYSANDPWAAQTLQLYIKKFLGRENNYQYRGFEFQYNTKPVIATKFRPFKLFSYRYCLIIDCIFICAYRDKDKAEKIFTELSSVYHKRYQKRIRQVFDSLFDPSISTEGIKQIQYLKSCWDTNRKYIENDPIKVIVTANMSAGKSTLLKPWTWFQEKGHWKDVYEDKEYVDGTKLAQRFFAPIQEQLYENSNNAIEYAKVQTKKIKQDFSKKFVELDTVLKKKLQELEDCANDNKNVERRIRESQVKLKWLEEIQIKTKAILDI